MATRPPQRKSRSTSDKRRVRSGRTQGNSVFQRRNYLLLLLGVGLIVLGYVLMRVDNQIDGFISLYIAPLLLLGGYLEIIYAILARPGDKAAVAS